MSVGKVQVIITLLGIGLYIVTTVIFVGELMLIRCPDCGKDVSSVAEACPNCGRPVATEQKNPNIMQEVAHGKRIACPDVNCTGIIGESGRCGTCGKHHSWREGLSNCYNCGHNFSTRVLTCPKCGAVRLKECHICQKQIPATSVICPGCADPDPFFISEGPVQPKKTDESDVSFINDSDTSEITSDSRDHKQEDKTTKNGPEGINFLGGVYHPWRRFFARSLDTCGGLLLLFPIAYVSALLFPDEAAVLDNFFKNPFIVLLFLGVLWFPIEAVLLSTAGNTPARFLFGISVQTTSGQKLSFDQALSRSFQVLLQGEGLGVPFVALFTRIFAYCRLVRTGTTLWDQASGSVVSHKKWGVVRVILCTLAVFLVFTVNGQYTNKHLRRQIDVAINSNQSKVDALIPTTQKPDVSSKIPSTLSGKSQGSDVESVIGGQAGNIEELQKATRLRPDDANAWFNLGDAYFQHLKQLAKAIEAYRQATRLNPDHADAWSNLGFAYKLTSQDTQAIEAYQQATRLDPNDATTWYLLGTSYWFTNQKAKAIEAYQQAVRIDPGHANVWYDLGSAYLASGNKPAALDVVKKLRQLDPEQADKLVNYIVPR